MGNVYLLGQDSDIWENPDVLDLIALNARREDDLFSKWVADCLVEWYHQILGRYIRVYALDAYGGRSMSHE